MSIGSKDISGLISSIIDVTIMMFAQISASIEKNLFAQVGFITFTG
jgi:hypothetical protein